jgi:hypothetical protein
LKQNKQITHVLVYRPVPSQPGRRFRQRYDETRKMVDAKSGRLHQIPLTGIGNEGGEKKPSLNLERRISGAYADSVRRA